MKFGGTSVGSAERIRVAARLSAERRQKQPVVIVVSAMSGITDVLLETTQHAEAGDRAGRDAKIPLPGEPHRRPCTKCVAPAKQKPGMAGSRELIGEFQRITHG